MNNSSLSASAPAVCPWCHRTIAEPTLREHVQEFHRLAPREAERLNTVLVESDPPPRDWLDHEHQNAAGTICPWCWGDIQGETMMAHVATFHRLSPRDAERVHGALQREPDRIVDGCDTP